MKRKVNQVGTGTLTVSLPSKWVEKHSLVKGQEIEVIENGEDLRLSASDQKHEKRKAFLNLDNFNKMMINRYLHEFYRQGIEEITLYYTKDHIPDYKNNTTISIDHYVKKVIDRFIGLEIISQTKNKIILESLLTKEETVKLPLVQKRIFFLIKEFQDEFLKAMDGDFLKFHNICYDIHDNIARFIYYYLRLLHSSDLPEDYKTRLFNVYMFIDKMIDKMRNISERIQENNAKTLKMKSILKDIFSFFQSQFVLLHQPDTKIDQVEELIHKRYALMHSIIREKFTPAEYQVMMEARILIDIPDIFVETFVSLNLEKFTSTQS